MKLPKVSESQGEFVVPDPGVYLMEFSGYDDPVPNKFDPEKLRIMLHFRICDGDEFDGVEIRQWFGYTMHPQSRLYPVIKALLGRDIEEDEAIDLDDLVGARIMGTIQIQERPRKDGNGSIQFANLVAAAPVRRKKNGHSGTSRTLADAKRQRAAEFAAADDDTWDDEA